MEEKVHLYQTDTEHPDEVIFNENVHEEYYNIYKPDGMLLARSNNMLALHDALLQIQRKKLKGYTLAMDGSDEKSEMTLDAMVRPCPPTLGKIDEDQMCDILGF